MLVLADTACLAHDTIELLGSKLIPAKESPERLTKIMDAIKASDAHKLHIKHTEPEQSIGLFGRHERQFNGGEGQRSRALSHDDDCMKLLLRTHDHDYLMHLMTAHERWVQDGLIEEHESILPECFRVPTKASVNVAAGSSEGKPARSRSGPPKDIYAQTGYFAFDMSTGMCKDTWSSTWASALLAYSAALVLHGVYHPGTTAGRTPAEAVEAPKDVLALCRPPGHHCNTEMAGGYCYVNNAVVAVKALQDYHVEKDGQRVVEKLAKVAILDLDFHHGNGTQDAFYDDPSVLYVSIHGEDEYPYYSGSADETGEGHGEGYNCNLPLPTGSSAQEYMAKLDKAISRLQEFEPRYLVVSLGFDTFETDPLGCFKIGTEDYADIATKVRKSHGLQDVPAAILLEGGYVVDKLGANMLSFLKGWES